MMFISAASYATLRRVMSNTGFRPEEADPVIKRIDRLIAQEWFIRNLALHSQCKGPNGERMMFIPVEAVRA